MTIVADLHHMVSGEVEYLTQDVVAPWVPEKRYLIPAISSHVSGCIPEFKALAVPARHAMVHCVLDEMQEYYDGGRE